jgi:hypothetical protein
MAAITNVIRWADNTDQLRKNLSQGLDQVEALRASTERMVKSFSGEKLIQAAHNITAAVDKIGGAARLTTAEKQRLNTTLTKAIEKYEALGKTAPTAMRDLARDTATAQTKTDSWSSSLKSLAATIGVTFSVGAVVGFARELMRMGDEIVRVSDRTGLTTDEVQRLSYIARQSGNSIDEFTAALGKLQDNLGSGNKATLGALKQLNIDFDTLRRASPYQQLELIAEAVKKIPDPVRQAQIQVDLFGRSGLAILPSMKAEFKALGDEAPRMSDKTVQTLDKAGDALDRFALTLKVGAAEAYNYAGGLFDKLSAMILRVGADVNDFAADVLANIQRVIDKSPGGKKIFGDWTSTIADLRTGADTARTAADLLTRSVDDVAASAGRAVTPVENLTTGTDKHAEAVANLVNKLGGQDAIANARAWMSALREIGGLEKLAKADKTELSRVLDTALGAYKRIGSQAPVEMRKLADAARPPLDSTNLLVNALGKGPASLEGALAQLTDGTIPSYAKVLFQVSESTDAFDRVISTQAIPSLGDLGATLIDVGEETEEATTKTEKMNQTLSAVEEVLGGIQTEWAQTAVIAVRAIRAISERLAEGDWVGAIVAAAAALGQFIGKLFGKTEESSKVSPARDEFFKIQGGLERLNPLVEKFTGNLRLVENIFKAKTMADYNAAVQELTDLLALVDTGYKTVAETAKKYNLTIEEMGPAWARQELDEKAQELFKDYEVLIAAGVENTTVTKKMASAINDYVSKAIAMGVEVPAAMKPMLEDMVRNGDLLDANGNKIMSLEEAGISFAMTMSEGFRTLIDEVKKLTDVISRGLGTALSNIPDEEVVIRGRYVPPKDMPEDFHAGGIVERFHRGTANVLPFHRMPRFHLGMDEVPAILQTGEAVLNRGAAGALGRDAIAALNRGQRPGSGPAVDLSSLRSELTGLRSDLRRSNRELPHALKVALKNARVA